MGIDEVIRAFGATDGPVGEAAWFMLFFAERLRSPLLLMNGELEGRGDARRLKADFRVRTGEDGTLSGVEVALVMSDGTEFAREYCFGADGVYADDRAHAVMCLCGDAARRFGLKDQYGKVRTYSLGGRKSGFDEDEEADFAARLDESFCPGAVPVDAEPADTELRYVEVPKGDAAQELVGMLNGMIGEFAVWLRDSLDGARARAASQRLNLTADGAVELMAWEHPDEGSPYYSERLRVGGCADVAEVAWSAFDRFVAAVCGHYGLDVWKCRKEYDDAKYGCDVRDAEGFCRSMVDVGHIYMPSKTGPYNDTYYVSVGVIEVDGRRVGYAVVVDMEFMPAAEGGGVGRVGGVANASYTLNNMGYDMHASGKTFVIEGKTPMETFTEVYEGMLKDGRDFVASVRQRVGVTETDAVSQKGGERGR